MKCIVCRNGDTRPGFTMLSVQRGSAVLVVRRVPARICENCGEEYLEDSDVAQLGSLADEAAERS